MTSLHDPSDQGEHTMPTDRSEFMAGDIVTHINTGSMWTVVADPLPLHGSTSERRMVVTGDSVSDRPRSVNPNDFLLVTRP